MSYWHQTKHSIVLLFQPSESLYTFLPTPSAQHGSIADLHFFKGCIAWPTKKNSQGADPSSKPMARVGPLEPLANERGCRRLGQTREEQPGRRLGSNSPFTHTRNGWSIPGSSNSCFLMITGAQRPLSEQPVERSW